jgi:hypothetical protein
MTHSRAAWHIVSTQQMLFVCVVVHTLTMLWDLAQEFKLGIGILSPPILVFSVQGHDTSELERTR